MFAGNEENDLSDMAELAKKEDDLSVLVQLFQKEIEDIKKAKSDTDSKLNEIFLKNVNSISSEVLSLNLNRTLIKGFHHHDQVQPIENNVGFFA